jgi:hypothetical protein
MLQIVQEIGTRDPENLEMYQPRDACCWWKVNKLLQLYRQGDLKHIGIYVGCEGSIMS